MKPKVLLLEKIHEVAVSAFKAQGWEVAQVGGALKEAELIEKLKGIQILGIRSKTQVTSKVLANNPQLWAVGAFCIGTNQVDLETALSQGTCVFNAPFSNTRSVAEMILAEVVMLSRQLGDRAREMHQGQWRKLAAGAREVRGKTLGIVGYGHIGSQVGVLAEFFGMRVLFFDIAARLPLGNSRSCTKIETLLQESDFVTLHVPETPQTKGMMGEAQIRTMKKGACLLNASRGTVVDIGALARALKDEHLAGAAVDVFPEEPEENSADGFQTALQGLRNVVMTPHIGGSTLEAQEAIGREVSASLIKYVEQGTTTGSVNFPHVDLAPSAGAHRIVHIHRNVPGVLRDLNKLVSDQGANIQAQLLSTNADIGYLVMDVAGSTRADLVEAIGKLSTTVRVFAPV